MPESTIPAEPAPDGEHADRTERIATRFDMPLSDVRRHLAGYHVCVDGRWYTASCLIADEACWDVAGWHLAGRPRRRLAGETPRVLVPVAPPSPVLTIPGIDALMESA